MTAARETFQSSWGTILATAGAAIGLGNIWRFPYMMGIFGGATFLLVYLLVILLFGVPGLMVEWTLGRSTRRGPMGAFQRAGMPGGRWWGYLLLLTVTMAASYYAVVIAWVLYYLFANLTGLLSQDAGADFERLTTSLPTQAVFLLATVVAGCGVLLLGVRQGIEKVSKIVTPLFFLLVLILLVRALTLPGADEGVAYYLLPRWEQFNGTTVLAATGQAYFSLALGGTFMVIYGSYMRSSEDIPRTAALTSLADASAAFLAGLVVVPSVFAFDIDLRSGPELLFVVMPQVFAELPWGSFFAVLFFGSVFLIALLSLIAAYEVMVGAAADAWGWTRGQGLAVLLVLELVLAVPAMASLQYLFYSDLVWGSIMQPVGAVLSVAALTWWAKRVRVLSQMNQGSSRALPGWLFYWIRYAIPTAVAAALIYGLASLLP